MHGGNDGRIGATQTKRADLKQNCICLCILNTGTMPFSQGTAKKMSMALLF
jgi:hypothetical protein